MLRKWSTPCVNNRDIPAVGRRPGSARVASDIAGLSAGVGSPIPER
jgi:hypothetical protein